MEDVDENERRKLVQVVFIIEHHEVKEAWNAWRAKVAAQRHKELEWSSAVDIQRVFRGDKARTRVHVMRRELEEERAYQAAVR